MRSFLLGAKTEVKDEPTARDYVQDGLIAMWDGIENAGWGTHDGSASTWPSLISGAPSFVMNNAVWSEECLSFSTSSTASYSPQQLIKFKTIEIVINYKAIGQSVISFGPTYSGFGILTNGVDRPTGNIAFDTTDGVAYAPGAELDVGVRGHYAFVKDNPSDERLNSRSFKGGMPIENPPMSKIKWNGCAYGINGNVYANRSSAFDLFCIRIYSRALTAAEVAANYAVDQRRFGL